MLEILIDGTPVYPVEGGTFEIRDANPLLTQSGSYTYDIEIDLSYVENQKVYKHIERLNAASNITNRSVTVLYDGYVLLQGTEALLEITGSILKIQIVAGNCDINYISSQVKIKELDLGSFQKQDYETALKDLNSYYPKANGVCCPVMTTKFFACPIPPYMPPNNYLANFLGFSSDDNKFAYYGDTRLIVQPFLLYALERVLAAIGWTIKHNALLDDESACRMVVIHGFETLALNEMLPNWSVSEFISQIETFFNVAFVCDTVNNTLSIYKRGEFYSKVAGTVNIPYQEILGDDDKPSRKFSCSELSLPDYTNVKYNFPSVVKYQYADLSDEVLKLVRVLDFEHFSDFNTPQYVNNENVNKANIYHDKETDTFFVLKYDGIPVKNALHFEQVKIFQHIVGDDTISESENLKICPAEVVYVSVQPYINGRYYKKIGMAMPFTRNQLTNESSQDELLHEWIQQGPPEKYDSSNNNLYVAYYMGWQKLMHFDLSPQNPDFNIDDLYYPQCVTTPYIMQFYQDPTTGDNTDFLFSRILERSDFNKFDFSLKYRTETYFNDSVKIDSSTEYEIKFLSKSRPDVRSLFNISGRLFYCKELVYQIEKGRMSNYVTGIFYPAN